MTESASQPAMSAMLLEDAARPIYVVSSDRKIAYCNRGLAEWLGVDAEHVIGRRVEYHSEPDATGTEPLFGLCPPPDALDGHETKGTVTCVQRDGRLVHRRAQFIPLIGKQVGTNQDHSATEDSRHACSVMAIVETANLSAEELTQNISSESPDELHRAIRRFRRGQSGRFAPETLLGESPVMQRVRAQVECAASSKTNVLIVGRCGSGRTHLAKAIHYTSDHEHQYPLLPLNGTVLTQDALRRTVAKLQQAETAISRETLLIMNVDQLSADLQTQLAEILADKQISACCIGTMTEQASGDDRPCDWQNGDQLDPLLQNMLSTITIRVPRVIDRLEDIPLMAQFFLESCNQGNTKQVGGLAPETTDLLALYAWPGEVAELKQVIEQAHANCPGHRIEPKDLPDVIHHALVAASLTHRPPEPVDLDAFLQRVERELVERAMQQANGNKTEAARLLGLSRPRLYRRLVQLGLTESQEHQET